MSIKRQATTQLTHDNWDQEDPSEHEDMGTFKTATKYELQKRVIRTAKRRSQASSDEAKKGVFSSFSGFNKTQPSSFDFLSNLTNSNQNGATTKSDTSVTSSLFSAKPISSPGSGLFGTLSPITSDKSLVSTQTSSFANSSTTFTTTSVFSTSKPDSTVSDSLFKVQTASSSADKNTDTKTVETTTVTSAPTAIFGTTTTNKSLFSNTNNKTSFSLQPVSSTSTMITTNTILKTTSSSSEKVDEKTLKKLKYYTDIKSLNQCVSEWIKTQVEATPLCILSPIFRDYEKYLKEIKEEYEGPTKSEDSSVKEDKSANMETKTTAAETSIFSSNQTSHSIFSGKKNLSIDGNNSHYLSSTYTPPKVSPKMGNYVTPSDTKSIFQDKKGSLFGNSPGTSSNMTSAPLTFGVNTTTNQSSSLNKSPLSGDKAKAVFSSTSTTSTGFTFGINTPTNQNTALNNSPLSGDKAKTVFGNTSTTDTGFTFGVNTTSQNLSLNSSPLSGDKAKTVFGNTSTTNTGFTFGVNTTTNQNSSLNNSPLSGDKTKTVFGNTSVTHTGFTFGVNTSTNQNSSLNNSPLSGDKAKTVFGNTSTTNTGFTFGVNTSTNQNSSLNNFPLSADKAKSIFGNTSTTSPGFTFGINTATNQNSSLNNSSLSGDKTKTVFGNTSTTSTGFTFGVNTTTPQTSSTSGFPATTNSLFSFGTGKPFSFNSNITRTPAPESKSEEKEEDDEPPKVEYKPIVEENSVYDKKCKVFVKRDGNYVDKGVGTLYVKKIEETGKYQLLVRANTTLGNILLNLILSSVPVEKLGKNNVMLVCIPTPDEKPPPTPVLIRVKTSEEADELLETLKKYKTN